MLSKNILLIVFGRFIQMALMVYSIYLLTSLLPPDELGRYYLFMSLIAFPGLVLINPVGQFIARKTNSWYQKGALLKRLLGYALLVLLTVVVSSLILLVLLKGGFFHSLNNVAYIALFSGFVFFQTWTNLIPFILNLLFHRFIFIFLTILTAILAVLIPYHITVDSKLAVDWLLGAIIAFSIVTFLAVFFIGMIVKGQSLSFSRSLYEKNQVKSLFLFAFPLSIATFFMWIQSAGLRVLVEHFFTLEYLAFIGVGLLLSTQISMAVESVLSQIYQPTFFSTIENKNISCRENAINHVLAFTVPIYIVMLVFVTVFAQELFYVLVDDRYKNAYMFLIIAIVFDFFRMLTNQYALACHSELNTKKNVPPYAAGAFITVFAVSIGIYFEGSYYYLVPVIWSLGMFITFISMVVSTRGLMKLEFPFALSFKTVVLASPLFLFRVFRPDGWDNIRFVILEFLLAGLFCLLILYFLLKDRVIYIVSNKQAIDC